MTETMRPKMHMLHTCPFCWKVRSISEHLGVDFEKVQVNAMRTKKELKFAGDWGKVPVWTESDGEVIVDSTPIMKHIDSTYFGWLGGTEKDSVFYYRIQSPVVLIEFDHQRPIALARSRTPTRQHIHTVIRTPNGNDYGKDLLRQHYKLHHK